MRRVKRGLFITFEGVEGSGKTTQIKAVAQWLRRWLRQRLRGSNRQVVLTREPGGTPLADRIRSLLLDRRMVNLSPHLELLLYEVARRDHVAKVIRPALRKGKIVLCDRFTDATVAYQGFGRGLSLKVVEVLNRLAMGGIKPDLTFLLNLPPAVGLKRAKKRIRGGSGGARRDPPLEDRFERETLAFHERVRNGYLTLARKEKRRFRIIDARGPRKKVFARIRRELEGFRLPFSGP